MPKRKRNPRFTTDEIQTATRLVDEGYPTCASFPKKYKQKVYRYLRLGIGMCDKEALEPVARVFGTKIKKSTSKRVMCPPHLFPPDGKGRWEVVTTGKRAEHVIERLKPLLTKEFLRKHEEAKRKCA